MTSIDRAVSASHLKHPAASEAMRFSDDNMRTSADTTSQKVQEGVGKKSQKVQEVRGDSNIGRGAPKAQRNRSVGPRTLDATAATLSKPYTTAIATTLVSCLGPAVPGISTDWFQVFVTASARTSAKVADAPRRPVDVKVVFKIDLPPTTAATPGDALAASAAITSSPHTLAADMNKVLSAIPQFARPVISNITVAPPSFQRDAHVTVYSIAS